MIGLVLAGAGTAAFVIGVVLLNRGGPGYRVGRLLSVAPPLSLDEVAAAARAGEQRYVRTKGRVSSDEEFPDENDKPLVYRRQRLQARQDGRGWADVDDDRVAVPLGSRSAARSWRWMSTRWARASWWCRGSRKAWRATCRRRMRSA